MKRIGGAVLWVITGMALSTFPFGLFALLGWTFGHDRTGFEAWGTMGAIYGLALWLSQR